MPNNNTAVNKCILSEPLHDTSGYCSVCHDLSRFIADKEHGYYKQCPNCGNTEHLSRRFLKFDKTTRQWL